MTLRIPYPIEGRKTYQELARRALPILVRQAKASSPIYYSSLSRELGMKNPRNLDYVLGTIGRSLVKLSQKWATKIPPIEALVCNKLTDMPGAGVAGFLPDDYRSANRALQKKVLRECLWDIFRFGQWDQVLTEFKLAPLSLPHLSTVAPHRRAHRRMGVGAVESEEHKALKQFVSKHPELFGLPKRTGPGHVEFAFPSDDSVDVLFQGRDNWVGVEVKPRSAPEDEIERGIFQCIKYRALIEAYQMIHQIRPSSRVVLVLGGSLPIKYVGLQNLFQLEVQEGVRPC